MNIETEKYILKGDGLCMWIEQKYIGKDRKGNEKISTRRVTGYLTSFDQLLKSFVNRKTRGLDSQGMTSLLEDVSKIEEDLNELADGIGKALERQKK